MGKSIVYGIGGYDQSKPNDNIVEIIDTPDEAPLIVEEAETANDKLIAAGLSQDEIDALIQEAAVESTTEEETNANA